MVEFFVSSTFIDMDLERDILASIVNSRVNEYAKKHFGEHVLFMDLRWGIDTIDMTNETYLKKVVNSCVDSVLACAGYMIVLLGERYGTEINVKSIDGILDKEKYDKETYSVTALEIMYGAYGGFNPRVLFYRKKTNKHDKRVDELCDEIESRGYKIKEYNPITSDSKYEFADLLSRDIIKLLDSQLDELESDISEYYLDQRIQWKYVEEKSKGFVKTHVVDSINRVLNISSYCAVVGERGIGKSSVLAYLCQVYKNQFDYVVPIFCNTTSLCTTFLDVQRYEYEILQYIVSQNDKPCSNSDTKKILNKSIPELKFEDINLELAKIKHSDQANIAKMDTYKKLKDYKNNSVYDGGYRKKIASLYNQIKELNISVLFVIDGLDDLFRDYDRSWRTIVLYSDNVNTIFSCTQDFLDNNDWIDLGHHLTEQFYRDVIVDGINEKEKELIINSILMSNGKPQNKHIVEYISRKEMSYNPLYVSLIIKYLCMFEKNDYVNVRTDDEYIKNVIKGFPNNIEDVVKSIIIKSYGSFQDGLIPYVSKIIANTMRGINEYDLMGIVTLYNEKWVSVVVSDYLKYLMANNIIIKRSNGLYSYSHSIYKKALFDQETINDIANYCNTLDENNSFRMDEYFPLLLKLNDYTRFCSLFNSAIKTTDEMFYSRYLHSFYIQCIYSPQTIIGYLLKDLDDKLFDINAFNFMIDSIFTDWDYIENDRTTEAEKMIFSSLILAIKNKMHYLKANGKEIHIDYNALYINCILKYLQNQHKPRLMGKIDIFSQFNILEAYYLCYMGIKKYDISIYWDYMNNLSRKMELYLNDLRDYYHNNHKKNFDNQVKIINSEYSLMNKRINEVEFSNYLKKIEVITFNAQEFVYSSFAFIYFITRDFYYLGMEKKTVNDRMKYYIIISNINKCFFRLFKNIVYIKKSIFEEYYNDLNVLHYNLLKGVPIETNDELLLFLSKIGEFFSHLYDIYDFDICKAHYISTCDYILKNYSSFDNEIKKDVFKLCEKVGYKKIESKPIKTLSTTPLYFRIMQQYNVNNDMEMLVRCFKIHLARYKNDNQYYYYRVLTKIYNTIIEIIQNEVSNVCGKNIIKRVRLFDDYCERYDLSEDIVYVVEQYKYWKKTGKKIEFNKSYIYAK